tara:strand:- start:57 stop:299 length:243 start_codon:yes stop_codon:yes gene_type:complete
VSKKSNFNIVPIIILVLLFQLVKQCHRNDWLNQSKPNKTLIEQKHKMNPEHMKRLFEKLKKEGKIKDKNFERKKPINPNK